MPSKQGFNPWPNSWTVKSIQYVNLKKRFFSKYFKL